MLERFAVLGFQLVAFTLGLNRFIHLRNAGLKSVSAGLGFLGALFPFGILGVEIVVNLADFLVKDGVHSAAHTLGNSFLAGRLIESGKRFLAFLDQVLHFFRHNISVCLRVSVAH